MKQPILLKLAAVASSALLVGAFVSYRAGAYNWLVRPEPTTIMSGSKSKVLLETYSSNTPNAQPPATSDQPNSVRTIMAGSKSGIVIKPPPPNPVPTIMSSSKSVILIDPSLPKNPAGQRVSTPQPSKRSP